MSQVYFFKNTPYTENTLSKTTLLKYTFEERGLGEDDGSEPSVPILVNGIAHPSTTVTKHKTFHIFNVNGKWVNGKW